MARIHKWALEESNGAARLPSVGTLSLLPQGFDPPSAAGGVVGNALNATAAFEGLRALPANIATEGKNAASFAGWLYVDALTGAQQTAWRQSDSTDLLHRLYLRSDLRVEAQWRDATGTVFTLTDVAAQDPGVFFHVVSTYERNAFARLYINAVEVDTVAVADEPLPTLNVTDNRFLVAEDDADLSPLIGRIDELEIHDTQLTIPEIAEILGTDANPTEAPNPMAGLIHLFEFDRLLQEPQMPLIAYDSVGTNHLPSVIIATNVSVGLGIQGNALDKGGLGGGMYNEGRDWPFENLDEWSVSCWLNLTSTGGTNTAMTWSAGNLSPDIYLRLRTVTLSGDQIIRLLYTDTTDTLTQIDAPGVPLIAGTWHLVCVTWVRNDAVRIYVDTELLSSTPVGDVRIKAFDPAISRFTPGGVYSLNSDHLRGRLDQVAIYNRALNTMDICVIYNGRLGINLLGLEPELPLLKNALAGLLMSIEDIGRVWTYEPQILHPTELNDFFFFGDDVRAWTIMRDAVQERDETNCEVLREHRVLIRGYLTFNPGQMSDTTFESLIENVLRVIRDNPSLNNLLEWMLPGSTTPTRFRLLAQSEPVHFVEIIVRMQHIVERLNQ